MGKVISLVRGVVREGDDCRQRGPPSAGPTGPLLVVCREWRYRAHRYTGQAANVDSYFHRCRAAEHIDGLLGGGLLDYDVLKQKFILLRFRENLREVLRRELG